MNDPAALAGALARAPLPDAESLRALTAALGPITVLDLETTGLELSGSRVIEIGAVRLEADGPPAFLHALVDPETPLPKAISHLTGLTDSDLAGRPRWREIQADVARFVAGTAIVAHNAAFERAFLTGIVAPETVFLDTLELACILRPELDSHSLANLAASFLERIERHRALDDALDTVAVLTILHGGALRGEHGPLRSILARPGARPWSWTPLLPATSARPGPGLDADRVSRSAERTRPPERAPGIDGIDASPEAVTALLQDEDRWRRVAPGYFARPEQIELARSVAAAFGRGRVLAAEAGTGVGKTLAYCLVAVLHALRTGERVIISSANRTLQERVVREELPRVCGALGIALPPALVMKGRVNYGNPRRARLLSERPEELGLADLSTSARLYTASFFARCPAQDLQTFGGWMLHNDPGIREIRDRIACQLDCEERLCRTARDGPCSYLRHVDALGHAAIVSINHSLLLRWPARYGPIDHLIIDEAHELAAEADRAFSEEVRAVELKALLGRLSERRRAGLLAAAGLQVGNPQAAGRIAQYARRAEDEIEEVGRSLREAGGEQPASLPRADGPARGAAWLRAAERVAGLAAGLVEIAEGLDDLVAANRGDSGGEQDGLQAELGTIALALSGQGRGLLADAFVQSREDTVYAARAWLRRDQTHDWWLRATPLETADRVHARLLDPARTVVAVSATLGVGGDPRPTLEKIGWEILTPDRKLPTRVIASPFDFARNSVLAFVQEGTYRDDGFNDRCARSVAEVARLLGGRTMALFTNAHRLEIVASRAAGMLAAVGISTLVQRRGTPAARLVGDFVADPRSVLFGTRSLWQGIDIPGEALSCVVIDKLPFPPPDDPLTRGRAQRIRAAGGDDFRALALEPAVVAFKQMFGRLIRTENDRGFVVVLGADPRKSYIADFIASLPGPPRLLAGSLADVLAEMRSFFAVPDD
jgi:ATP-dependent DNA helicase DinG